MRCSQRGDAAPAPFMVATAATAAATLKAACSAATRALWCPQDAFPGRERGHLPRDPPPPMPPQFRQWERWRHRPSRYSSPPRYTRQRQQRRTQPQAALGALTLPDGREGGRGELHSNMPTSALALRSRWQIRRWQGQGRPYLIRSCCRAPVNGGGRCLYIRHPFECHLETLTQAPIDGRLASRNAGNHQDRCMANAHAPAQPQLMARQASKQTPGLALPSEWATCHRFEAKLLVPLLHNALHHSACRPVP